MAKKRIHLATENGGRSRCRYTSRPSIRALFVPLDQFKAMPEERRCKECAARIAEAVTENLVFDLQLGERVCCYFCVCRDDHREYTKGEAFLAGPGHSPFDANANYVCRKHLDADAVIAGGPKPAVSAATSKMKEGIR